MTPIFVGDATPMENVMIELLKTSPVAVAVLATMIVFLRHVKARDEAFEKQQERWQATFDERLEKSEIVARDGHQCIRENTKVVGEVTAVIRDHFKSQIK